MRHITPTKIFFVIVLIAVLWFLKKKQGGGKPSFGGGAPDRPAARPAVTKPSRPPEEIFMSLREGALRMDPMRLVLPEGLKEDEPYGALMEMAMPGSVVTLACFADGEAGIYYQSGGGMKGGGSHESVRRTAKQFVALSQKALPRMIKTTAHPLPEEGKVRFYVLTQKGTFTTEAAREALGGTQSDLSTLFYSGQDVVAQMRQVQEERGS